MDEQLTVVGLNRRLAQVKARLFELGPDDHAERYRLKIEQDQLRSQSGRLAKDRDADRSTEDLKAELRARERALLDVRNRRVSIDSTDCAARDHPRETGRDVVGRGRESRTSATSPAPAR